MSPATSPATTRSASARRRGATAVEFVLTLPLLLILLAGVVDLGQYLFLADSVAAAVAEGARAGALANPKKGEDPLAVSRTAADQWWLAAELPSTLTTTARLEGVGAPNERLVVTGTVPFGAAMSILNLPATVRYTHTIRLFHQP